MALKVLKLREKKYLSGTVPRAILFIISHLTSSYHYPRQELKQDWQSPAQNSNPCQFLSVRTQYRKTTKWQKEYFLVLKTHHSLVPQFLPSLRSDLILYTGLGTSISDLNHSWQVSTEIPSESSWRVFLITHMQPEGRKTSKNSIPAETKWKITLQFWFQANNDEQSNGGKGRRREGRVWERMNRENKKRKP